MNKLFFILLLSFYWVTAGGCEKVNPVCNAESSLSIGSTGSREEDNAVLKQLAEELYQLSGSSSCTNRDNWKIAPMGAKPCGGPSGYIAYKSTIDEACFLIKLDYYNDQVAVYNQKYQLLSDCSVPAQPKAVVCENNKPVFTY